jgi:polyisoprenoid-binding protein YceI
LFAEESMRKRKKGRKRFARGADNNPLVHGANNDSRRPSGGFFQGGDITMRPPHTGRWIGTLLVIGITTAAMPVSDAAPPAASQATVARPRQPAPGDLELNASRVFVHVDKTGLGHEHAVAGKIKSGRVVLGAGRDAGEIVFDMKSFEADGEQARKYVGLEGTTDPSTARQVTANMQSPSVLDTSKFPTAVFKIASATPVDELSRRGLPQYQLRGEFTLHGVSRPLTVLADVQAKDGWTHLRGGFAIRQTDFGIRPFQKALGAVGVADQLTIFGDVWVAGTQPLAQRAESSRATGQAY